MKVAVITGAAKRIGQVIAERLLADGFHLIAHAHTSMDDLHAWVSKHPKKAQVIDCVAADLSTPRGQDHLVATIKSQIDSIELIVHNASMFYEKPFSEIDRKALHEIMEVNLFASYFITQGLLEICMRAENPSVINIIDSMWERPSQQFSHYAMSKAGLAILTRSLAIELAPTIRVNAVAPGAVLFQPHHSGDYQNRVLARIPQKKSGNPRDIADAVVFLHQSLYATGEILVIDGGRSILP